MNIIKGVRHPKPWLAQRNKERARHGMHLTITYRTWAGMLNRCGKNNKDHARYFDRGIRVCGRWTTFEHFLSDMGEKPIGMSLDRIDNEHGYEPGNCRWASPTEQSQNRRNSRIIEFNGQRKVLAQWARDLGMSRQTLRHRLEQGWPLDQALTVPVNHGNAWRLGLR